MPVINTNVNALLSANALTANSRVLGSTMQQLSTGSRVNSAKDDAAGLAIGSKMTAQIRGLDMAVRNANDGVSLLQTAEGATTEIGNMLQRMRELSVQSANDTNATQDRAALNTEFQQLKKEITRIAENTQWNGMNIMSGSAVGVSGAADTTGLGTRNVKFQVGANADQTISIGLKDFSFSTGVAPTASRYQMDIAATNLSGTATVGITVGGHAFSVAGTVAASNASAGEATAIAASLNTAIRGTVGYEDVSVTAEGTAIYVNDSQGRTVGTMLTTGVSASAITNTGVGTVITSGSTAGAATAPASTAVFGSGSGAVINTLDVTDLAKSNTAITTIDLAIKAVNTERATMGAVMNRLTYAADNLTNVSQNTSESRSRILDTDYASATSKLAKSQIIAQAATAMLAQANQQPQSVLALLK